MTNRSRLAFITLCTFSMIVGQQQAKAATPNEPCSELGTTSTPDEDRNTFACLYNGKHQLVWVDLLAKKTAVLPTAASPLSSSDALDSRTARWQGWYVGGNVGVADTTDSYDPNTNGYTKNLHTYGGTAGVVGGYNWVKNNDLFYGGEADINYVSNSERLTPTMYSTMNSAWNGYATARGRVGMAFNSALVFLTGGVALVDVNNKLQATDGYPVVHYGFSDTALHIGWTAGAGAEFALTDNISMNAQYLRLEMPEDTRTAFDGYNGTHNKYLLDNSANILRVGLNWHFD